MLQVFALTEGYCSKNSFDNGGNVALINSFDIPDYCVTGEK